MNEIRRRRRDGSEDNPRESAKKQDYFDLGDDGVMSETGSQYHK